MSDSTVCSASYCQVRFHGVHHTAESRKQMSQNGLVDGLVDEDHHLVDIDVLVDGLN